MHLTWIHFHQEKTTLLRLASSKKNTPSDMHILTHCEAIDWHKTGNSIKLVHEVRIREIESTTNDNRFLIHNIS